MKISKLPEAEFKVMRYIWESDKVLTSREIVEAMKQKYEWKDTTTFTVLKRLQRREFLETEKIDKRTHYNVLVKEKQYQRFETIEFIKNIHKNSIKSLISALHKDDENVDEKKLDELEEYFNNLEENEK
ncbi:TPA: BlaI/MecI/CopY family transcriptional regulator [Clostridioides difficile]|uniref:BlaI/MecI/CopY family transcriptional regulator n=1 Tax=Clostridioides difficile TaxID=1496 RepID=UPI001C285BBD|nr:BlaI/MecI/CopY family transcriptional regulator [Clostridioides difficile]UUV13147.1 BlaI/MecI/CopY family transcriptional regulator [Clostridioides difficile]HBF1646908.1 BlaI/MecI/CopY family transcriptional regulator [Clostridioides difficile]HBH3701097.1 BlaI/MecI/CopY family transcriptional regulator [Clostridioides difficile]HBH4023390.1 BlaI/MecI/CopY family transcriptional regulator [Clostridioides difficile]HCU2594700.1 BlaI/MecI/CopY family transcriptional regulator [Clostridioide